MMESRNAEICIPMELWFDILSLLPVKTLLRFRAVSKSFLALIDDPNFVSFHLRCFPVNCHETHLLVTTGGNFQIHETAIAGTTSKSINSLETGFPGSYHYVRGSIDGLFLLSDGGDRFNLIGDGLLLGNPSTRKKRWLPFPSWFVSSENVIHSTLLCHDHSRRDYKVLLLQCQYIDPGRTHTQVGLYSVGKGSWKTLENGVFGVSWRNMHSGVSFSGGVAWVELDLSKDRQRRHLVSFDFGTETTRRYVALPCSSSARSYNLFRVDGGLGLGFEADGQVWELETEKMTWTSLYKIGAELTPLKLLAARKENGELVFSTRGGRRRKIWWYDTKTMEIKNYEEVSERARDVRVHVESMVKL